MTNLPITILFTDTMAQQSDIDFSLEEKSILEKFDEYRSLYIPALINTVEWITLSKFMKNYYIEKKVDCIDDIYEFTCRVAGTASVIGMLECAYKKLSEKDTNRFCGKAIIVAWLSDIDKFDNDLDTFYGIINVMLELNMPIDDVKNITNILTKLNHDQDERFVRTIVDDAIKIELKTKVELDKRIKLAKRAFDEKIEGSDLQNYLRKAADDYHQQTICNQCYTWIGRLLYKRSKEEFACLVTKFTS